MFRRQVLKQSGVMLAGVLALSGSASGREDGELPNDEVAVTNVSVFRGEENPEEVPAGSWLNHIVGWVDAEGDGIEDAAHESTEEDVERWLDAVKFSAWIDGDSIPDADQRWSDPFETDEGTWATLWEYHTPPKSIGVHTFRTAWYYPNGFTDGPYEIAEGARFELTGYYKVGKRGKP